jgi:hypothetical protein
MSTSIFSTVECDAWARDFDYQNYLERHEFSGCRGATLGKDAYDAFCQVMDAQLESDIGRFNFAWENTVNQLKYYPTNPYINTVDLN